MKSFKIWGKTLPGGGNIPHDVRTHLFDLAKAAIQDKIERVE